MKKMKRFLTALLCTCVLAGIMMTVASAVTILTTINLTVTAPAVGKRPEDTTASVPDYAHSVVRELEWSGDFDSNGAFMAGKKYTATITMGIKPGEDWKFSDNVTMSVSVNEKAADKVWYIDDGELQVVYTFPALPGGGTSTSSATVLKEAKITLTAPETGKTPAKTATVPSSASYTVKKVEWDGSLSSGKFKENTEYTAYVTLGIKSGKNAVFSDEVFDANVNGYIINEIRWVSATEIIVPVEFEKTAAAASSATVLKEAKITLTAPETGKTPAKTATVPSSASYTVKKVEWDGSLSSGKFKENTEYTAYVTLGIKSGKNAVFSDKVFDADVNGYIINEIRWVSATEIIVPVEFEKTAAATVSPTVLKEAKITLTAPETGKTPATTATVPSSASYTVKKVEWSGSLSSGKFKENTEYTAYVTLGIKSGKNAVFSDKVFDADVNGYIINEIRWVSATEIIVPVEFEKTGAAAPKYISKIQLTIDAPAWGKKPAATASVPESAHTAVRGVKWSGQLDTDGTFMPRVKYTVTVTMGIKEGANNYFTDKANSIDVTVNGKAAEAYWHSRDEVEVVYTFPETNSGTTGIISVAKLTIDGPAAGEKPASTAHIASTASTYVKSVRWEGALDSSGRFQAGMEYTAYITLAMKENGRKFSEKSFDATVNGVLIDQVTRVSDTEIIIPVEFEKTPGTAPTTPVTPSAGTILASGTAYASTQTVDIDGKKVEFQMYALRDAAGNPTNYIKVRDLALALNGTRAQFNVVWDGAVNLVSGRPYTKNGSENSTPFRGDRAYNVPTSATNVNNSASDLTAITLTDDNGGGYTYYQLRDLGRKLGFNVSWSSERGVYVETDKQYTDD